MGSAASLPSGLQVSEPSTKDRRIRGQHHPVTSFIFMITLITNNDTASYTWKALIPRNPFDLHSKSVGRYSRNYYFLTDYEQKKKERKTKNWDPGVMWASQGYTLTYTLNVRAQSSASRSGAPPSHCHCLFQDTSAEGFLPPKLFFSLIRIHAVISSSDDSRGTRRQMAAVQSLSKSFQPGGVSTNQGRWQGWGFLFRPALP